MKLFNIKRYKSENLIFIFGCPRGGTTWIWSILESHNDVLPFLLDYNKIGGKFTTSESGVYVKSKNPKGDIKKIIKNNPDKVIIEKTPRHLFYYNQIKKDFPESKNIIVFRNPLAIVSSMVNSNMKAFKNYDIEKSIVEVKKYYSVLIKIFNLENTICFTYENLYKNKEFEVKRILNFIGLCSEDLDKIIKENNIPKVNVKGAFRKVKPYTYLEELSSYEIEYISSELKYEIEFFKKLEFEYSSN